VTRSSTGDFSAPAAAENIVDEQRDQREPLFAADLATLRLIQADSARPTTRSTASSRPSRLVVDDGAYSSTLIEIAEGSGARTSEVPQYS
jgi:hypothetical protein